MQPLPNVGQGATALQRHPMRGSLTSSVFGDLEVSAVTLKFVPPSPSVVANTFGALFVIFVVIPLPYEGWRRHWSV